MNSRLTVAAHVLGMLAFLDREEGRGATSEELAESVGTNPVVVRRIIGRLAEAGLVSSRRGAGGGTTLARNAKSINLREAYEALLEEDDYGLLGRYASPPSESCAVAPVISEYLDEVFGEAEQALLRRLAEVDVETMSRAIVSRMRAKRNKAQAR